jgi:hypothetical protein
MFPRAAVSRYPVNKLGKFERYSRFLRAGAGFQGIFRVPENAGSNKKAGVKAGLSQF